jgi:hypothetical protein
MALLVVNTRKPKNHGRETTQSGIRNFMCAEPTMFEAYQPSGFPRPIVNIIRSGMF